MERARDDAAFRPIVRLSLWVDTLAREQLTKGAWMMSTEKWLGRNLEPHDAATIAGARFFVDAVVRTGGAVLVSTRQTESSLGAFYSAAHGQRATLLHLWAFRCPSVSFSLAGLDKLPGLAAEPVRADLYDRLAAIVGPLSTKNLNGYPAFPVARLAERPDAAAFRDWLGFVVERARRTPPR